MDRQTIIELIEREERKQVERKGYTPEHDAQHTGMDWQAILAQEVGGVATAALNDNVGIGPAIIKVAAVCLKALAAYPWPDTVAKLAAQPASNV